MAETQFYFLSEKYYLHFPDDKLMRNKEMEEGKPHNRPCFFAFSDENYPEIKWIVPISSRCEKYKKLYKIKQEKYGNCNTIRFGELFGRETVFLIQNICPALPEYLIPYMDKNNQGIQIDNRIRKDIIKNAREVLAISKSGRKIVFPDIWKIYRELISEISKDNF